MRKYTALLAAFFAAALAPSAMAVTVDTTALGSALADVTTAATDVFTLLLPISAGIIGIVLVFRVAKRMVKGLL